MIRMDHLQLEWQIDFALSRRLPEVALEGPVDIRLYNPFPRNYK